MSTIYKGAIPATYFTAVSKQWRGTGVVIHLLPDTLDSNPGVTLAGLNAKVAKVKLGLPDPGYAASRLNRAQMQALWAESDLAVQGVVKDTLTALSENGFTTMAITVSAPPSWLSTDVLALTGDMLLAYAQYVSASVSWLMTLDYAVRLLKYVELFEEPDKVNPFPHVSPQDLVSLATRLKAALTLSNPGVSIIGPGLSRVSSLKATTDPYTDVFIDRIDSLAIYTVHAEPHPSDLQSIIGEETGTDGQGDLIYRCLQKNVAYISSIAWEKERWVTSFGATVVPSAENYAYGIAAARAFCAILKSGFTTACFHTMLDDERGLYMRDMSLTWWRGMYARFGEAFPINGSIYVSEEMAHGDDTLKAMVLSPRGDRFAILLCRPHLPDTMKGSLRLIIRNPLWSDQYKVVRFKVEAFPTETDLSAVTSRTTIATGHATISLSNLPYQSSVLIASGEVELNPPLPPRSDTDGDGDEDAGGNSGETSSVLCETILQVPVHYGVPGSRFGTIKPGTFYYDSKDKRAKVYGENTWSEVTMLGTPT